MASFLKKLKKAVLLPARLAVRAGFGIARGIKGFSFKKLVKAISTLGENIVRFIYNTGLAVETFVISAAKIFGSKFVKACKFVYRTGERVIFYTVKFTQIAVKIIMIIPKSFVRDFSYWAPAICCVGVIVMLFSTNFYALALKVTVNGNTAGYVENESQFSQVVSKVEDNLGDTIGENYVMTSQPEYAFAIVSKEKIKDTELYENVYSIVCEEIGEHYGLYVDGQLIAATEKEQSLTDILDELKAPYVTDDENTSVEFVANVEIKKGIYAPSYFLGDDEIRAMFSSSTNPRYYIIQEDDYLSDISKATGLSRSQLYALNPDLDETKLVPGKKVNISQPDVYLGIKTVKTITYTEEIDYKTKKIEDSSLYKTQTKVKTAGKKGEKKITAKVTYIDGATVDKTIVNETVISEPVTREIYVGTKALPTTTSPLAGTGTFIRPINGGYTSCAFRGYSGHSGVDLTMSGAYGKPVYASASGTVVFAGWSGGYGKCIRISHANGYTTYYAHLSSIDVSVGASVYQGQQIGRIGSTGNSSGPHLHFELRINGAAVNPLKYIG